MEEDRVERKRYYVATNRVAKEQRDAATMVQTSQLHGRKVDGHKNLGLKTY